MKLHRDRFWRFAFRASVFSLLFAGALCLDLGLHASTATFVDKGKALAVQMEGQTWQEQDGSLQCGGTENYLHGKQMMGPGDFEVVARLSISNLEESAASFVLNDSHFGFEGKGGEMWTEGSLLGRKDLGKPAVKEDVPFEFRVARKGSRFQFKIDGQQIHETPADPNLPIRVGLRPWRSTMRVAFFQAQGHLQDPPKPLWHTDVFVAGQDGYHTYRIPAIVTTQKGTLLAFCEGRKGGRGDAGHIETVLKRSTDGGKTWSAMQVVAKDEKNTVGNPCPVVEQSTDRIWLPLTWNLGSDHEGEIMKGTSKFPRLVYITYSDDDGETWAPIKDISKTARKDHWRWYATGPGQAIQLTRGPHKGRLVIPSNHSDHSNPGKHPYRSHVLISDDHGKTWSIGGIVEEKTNESTVVELSDGRVMDNMRSYHGRNRRAIAISQDGGQTFGDVFLDETLIEPVCQASIMRYTFPDTGGRSRILFANPASRGREQMTVRLSYDEGKTWPVAKLIHTGSSAYCCLTTLGDMSIGLLYERDGYKRIVFTKIDLEWLTDGKDKLGHPSSK